MTQEVVTYPKLTIRTNHGYIILEDASVVHTYEYRSYGMSPDAPPLFIGRIVEGTVIEGAESNRLFYLTSTRKFQPGKKMAVDLYGRKIYSDGRESNAYWCSLETCG